MHPQETLYNVLKLEFYAEPKKLDAIEFSLKEEGVSFIRMNLFCIEITKKGVSKASAIKQICNMHNIKTENIMTIGDSKNDEEMLKITNFSYSMGNAPDFVKN